MDNTKVHAHCAGDVRSEKKFRRITVAEECDATDAEESATAGPALLPHYPVSYQL